MSDFLSRMARASAERVTAARALESESALLARALAAPAPRLLTLHARGFDLIAEIKRQAPSAGTLAQAGDVGPAGAAARATAYARAGAAVVSVLTEPDSFGGTLEDLGAASAATPVPTLRKDFLVDPYQVLEARAAGASGVLVILRMLNDARLAELLDAAGRCGLFVLAEAFDAQDLARACSVLASARPRPARILVGLNTRDLATLACDRTRLRRLRDEFPPGSIAVAESGVATGADAREIARLGYRLALVGSALMRAPDPAALVGDLLAAGREEAARCASA
jgi:indole-3-glycerol phosphate synthase